VAKKRKKPTANRTKNKTYVKGEYETFPEACRRKNIRRCMTPLWILSGIAFAIAGLSIGYHHKLVALWSTFFGVVLALAAITVWLQTVIEPDADSVQKERPYVIFRTTSVRPLAVGEYPLIQYELENIGTVEARIVIKNSTCWFTQDANRRSFEYPARGEVKFILAPSQKIHGQMRFNEHILTDDEIKALNEERGRLIFFAQGEYTDHFGTQTYELPFCRMYHPDILGNVVFCEDDIKFKEIGKSDK
jgi:hypothetical protein